MSNDRMRPRSERLGTQRKNEKFKSNGWKGGWQDRHDISRAKADKIMLTPGNYENPIDGSSEEHYWTDLFQKVSHKGSFRLYRQNDVLMARHQAGDARVEAPKQRWAFNIIHFDIYRKEDVLDDQGRPRTFTQGKNAGKVITNWKPVEAIRDRKDIKRNITDLIARGEVAPFRKKYIEVGQAHYNNLLEIDRLAKLRCRCSGRLEAVAYECEHCGELLVDVDSSDLTEEELIQFGDNERRCKACGVRDFPKKIVECDSCSEPTPLRFWEVVAHVRKSGEGAQTVIAVEDVVPVNEFVMEDGQHVVEMSVEDETTPSIDENGNFIFVEEIDKLVKNQFDFEVVYEKKDDSFYSDYLELRPGDPGYASGGGSRPYAGNRPAGRIR
jgi:hypothetical protein